MFDSGENYDMNFRRYFFEEVTDNVDGASYFTDKSKLKPSRLGTINLKLPSPPYFVLHDVIYLPDMRRNLQYLVHIHQQENSIHIFNSKVEDKK